MHITYIRVSQYWLPSEGCGARCALKLSCRPLRQPSSTRSKHLAARRSRSCCFRHLTLSPIMVYALQLLEKCPSPFAPHYHVIILYTYLMKLIPFGLWRIEMPHSKYVEHFDLMLQNYLFSYQSIFLVPAMCLIEYMIVDTMVRINIYRIFRWCRFYVNR